MKRIYYIMMLFAGLWIMSCSEDKVGQPPKDSIPPSPVFNVQIEELPGGAMLMYELPNEPDISYVKGEFLFQGEKRVVRSSIYSNYLIVEGLGSVEPVEISLYLVDHSENVSEPVSRTFTPRRPPIESILESMELVADFSGCNVAWENPLGIEIGVFFFAADDEGALEEVDVLFTPAMKYNYTMRKKEGQFGTDERLFAVTIMDKWGNTSDTVQAIITPFLEKQIDKTRFLEVGLPYDNTTVNNNRPLRNTWDGNTGSIWHTVAGAITVSPQFFTIDLGIEAKLSRFMLWNRGESYYYNQHNPQFFEVWGTKELKTGEPEEYWYEDWKNDWELLGDYEVVKPSGSPLGTVTADDRAIADAGFQFPFPLSGEAARYVRFVVKQTFMNTLALHIAEITFFGSDGNDELDD